jgi:acyl-CoA hydrolase
MNPHKEWLNEKKALCMAEALRAREFSVQVAENLTEAKEMALAMIPEGATVAAGGSTTLEEMDMVNTLRNGPYRFFDRYQKLPFDEIVDIYRESVNADVLVTSVNAVTHNGELVLTDSSGNRVAGLTFGAKKAIVIVGVNKFVKDINAALERIREIEPMNCRRNRHTTVSAQTGFFTEEVSKQRMMNVTGIIHYGGKFEGRINIIVVKQEAGF